MRKDKLNAIKHIVMHLLKNGNTAQALGVAQGAGIMADPFDMKMRDTYDDFMQMHDWINLAVECEVERKAEGENNV